MNFISERLSETWITVSDGENATICNEIINGKQDVVMVTCNYNNTKPPIRGRFVTIQKKTNANSKHLLNFCEVEVLSCPPRRWGYNLADIEDCSQVCDRCHDSVENCRVSDGYCFSGCAEGNWGNSCDKQCNCQACDRMAGCPPGMPV